MFNKLINIKLFGKFRLSFMFTRIQNIEGITSTVSNEKDKHYIFFDFDNMDYITLMITLREIQKKHNLADIFIFSDKLKSYRAFCFSKRTFKEYLGILLETKGIDWSFINWTFKRQKATLRIQDKQNREKQKLVAVLNGFESYDIPENRIYVNYETGINKIGLVNLGK